jgi:hypothetical protein
MVTFSEESRLYSQEYALVKQIERRWEEDLIRFHKALFMRVSHQLRDLKTRGTENRYWSLAGWDIDMYFWQPVCYPQLLRDNRLEFYVYVGETRKIWEVAHPLLQSHAQVALSGMKDCLELELGSVDGWRPVTVAVPWKDDPLEEAGPVLVDALRALDGLVPTLRLSLKKQ